MGEFLQKLSQGAKGGLVVGMTVLVLALAASTWWILRTEYQVLFADLKPQDVNAMTTELERQKIPYRLGENGTAILVDASMVHTTRIKLMGKEFPLHGAVGFELFNTTDFGMTEFAQKINFQRALQGELTRTILSLNEVRDARVHLALPEQGLFKQATSRAKASITLTLREGQRLRMEQIAGIQRLVAAAVPGMTVQDVTIVDNGGVALTRPAGQEGEQDAGGRLDVKRDTESYLARKAATVLDQVFGAGQTLTSVDVTLDMDQMRVTTEDVVPGPGKTTGAATGVVVRERESLRDTLPPLDARVETGTRAAAGTAQREVDYAVGRRVEQVVAQPGAIRRMQVVAVVRGALSAEQEDKVRRMVMAAVGALPDRGDMVVVQSMAALSRAADPSPAALAGTAGPAMAQTKPDGEAVAVARSATVSAMDVQVGAVLLCMAVGAAIVYAFKQRTGREVPLSKAQRAIALERVQDWLQGTDPLPAERPTGPRP